MTYAVVLLVFLFLAAALIPTSLLFLRYLLRPVRRGQAQSQNNTTASHQDVDHTSQGNHERLGQTWPEKPPPAFLLPRYHRASDTNSDMDVELGFQRKRSRTASDDPFSGGGGILSEFQQSPDERARRNKSLSEGESGDLAVKVQDEICNEGNGPTASGPATKPDPDRHEIRLSHYAW